MDKTLLIRAHTLGVDALLCLNGMVLGKLTSGDEVRLPVHEFIQSGENRIQVVALNPILKDCSVHVRMELQKDRGSELLVVPQVLYEFNEFFSRGDRPDKSRLIDFCVDLPVSFPKWRYFDVLQSGNDDQDLNKIQDFIFGFLRHFQEKKINLLLPCFSVRNREIGIAYGLEPQRVHENFQLHMQRIVAYGTFPEWLWDTESWRLFPVSNTPVYALLNKQHQPLFQLQLNDDRTIVQIPMHVGVLGGEVFVLR